MKPRAVLVGPPGSGKTTVGRLLASVWAVSFRDTDADIEAAAGKPIPDIFVNDGEAHFRELEREAVRTGLAEHGGVLSLGGGAILSAPVRELLREHTVIFLTVELGEAVSRVGLDQGRPLLAVNPRATLRHLMEQRRPLYEEVATYTVETTGRTADEIVTEITKLPTMVASRGVAAHRPTDPSGHRADTSESQSPAMTRINVGGEKPYEVIIGDHITGHLPDLVRGAARAAVIFTASVNHDASHVVRELIDAGMTTTPIEVPDAEAAKTLEVAGRCWEVLAAAGFTRSDVIIGVGGGALTDLAGFVAAGWLRGVRWVPVATSVNGMVDAAIGGKTGINIAAGKNLVGAFHPPAGVLCDLSALRTLPPAHVDAGMAEVVKCGFIADPVILDLVGRGQDVLPELIERSARVKADVVSQDLRESGLREILNYGHTLAHAIEKVENYRWSHGRAVSVGLVYAAILGRLTGRPDFVEQTRQSLKSLDLPVSYDGPWAQLRATMAVDKKTRGSSLRFVLLDGLARAVTVPIDDEDLLARAYEDLRV